MPSLTRTEWSERAFFEKADLRNLWVLMSTFFAAGSTDDFLRKYGLKLVSLFQEEPEMAS